MAIKFSQFITQTSASSLSHIVGYNGADNIQITPADFFTSFATGTTGFIPKWTSSSNLGDSILEVNSALPSDVLMPQYIRHSGDTNTYFGFYSNDTFIVATSGNEVMRVNSSGNVGIGTASPVSKLDVIGGVTAQGTLVATGISQLGSGGANVFLTSSSAGNVGIGTSSPAAKLHVAGNLELAAAWQIGSNDGSYWQRIRTEDDSSLTANAFNFETRNGSGSFINHMTILNNGNVGIGTTSPVGKLYVGPTWTLTGGNDLYIKNQAATTSYDPSINNTQDLGITYNTSSAETTGPKKAGLVLHNDAGVAGQFSPMIIFSGREATPSQFKAAMAGIYARSPLGTGDANDYIDGELIFATAGAATKGVVQRMVINKEGLVGIGTSSPSAKLEVYGADNNGAKIKITNTNGADNEWSIYSNYNTQDLIFLADAVEVLRLGDGPSATFAGDINVLGEDVNFSTNGFADINNTGTGAIRLRPSGTTTALTISSSDATFSGAITNSGVVTSNRNGSSSPNSGNTNFYAVDQRSYDSGEVGGSIVLTGKYNNDGFILSGAPFVKCYKVNNTDGDYGFGLKLGVRENGSLSVNTALTIDSTSNVGIGTDSPGQKLDVTGGGVKIQSDGSAAAGAYLELKHPNNNTTDVCATINLTNSAGGYAAIIGGTTGANNTGYIEFKTDNAGTQGTVLTLNGDNSATFAGAIYGKNYSQSGTSGTTSIVDTGIVASQGAIYDVYVKGNMNGGGSGEYRSVRYGVLMLDTDFNYSNSTVVTQITFTSLAQANGGSGNTAINVVAKLLLSGTEYDEVNISDLANTTIRLRIGSYNSSYVGNNQEVRIIRKI